MSDGVEGDTAQTRAKNDRMTVDAFMLDLFLMACSGWFTVSLFSENP
jgi:hypothetical protein